MKKVIIVICVLLVAGVLAGVTFVTTLTSPKAEKIVINDGSVGNATASPNKHFPNLNTFTADTLDGGTFTAENFKGYDVTVINFWGTYCGPCREEMPQLGSFSKSLPSNIQFVTVCVDAQQKTSDAKSILSSADLDCVTITYGSDDMTNLYNKIQYIPTTLFFDSQGNCIGEEVVGGQSNVAAVYTQRLNAILEEMGKETL